MRPIASPSSSPAPGGAPGGGAARVLVAHSYFLRHDPKQVQKMKPYPPLATLIVAAILREAGHRVWFFDAMLAEGLAEFADALDRSMPGRVLIVEDNFNFLTKMCTLRMREATLEMVAMAHRRGARVAVNGSDAADHPELYLAAGADAVILGEPEETCAELLAAWSTERPLAEVAGLALDEGAGVRRTPMRGALRDLDRLPLPAWDLVDAERYRAAWKAAHGRLSWNMVASRGCPYGCNWCAKPLFGRGYAQRTPASVAREMALLEREIGAEHIWFADDIFGLTADWIARFAEEVGRTGARLPFTIQSRVNLMTPRVVAPLAGAGAEEVWLGVESGSQKILDGMDKGTRVEQIRAATATLQAAGVRACWFLQLGYLEEEWEDVLLTRDLVRECAPDDVGVSVAYPLPGTKFHQKVRAQLGTKQNWSDTDDLAVLFHGSYTTEFYRRVRDLLHDEVRTSARAGGRAGLDAEWDALAAERELFRAQPLSAARS